MKTKGKKNQNVGKHISTRKLEDYPLDYKKTGTKIPTSIKTPSQVKTVAGRTFRRLLHFMLVRINITSLDRAIKSKTGKFHNRGAVVRAEAKGFNEGYQKAVKDNQDKWL